MSKLTDADGEQQETQHWIDTALDCGYWDATTAQRLRQQCEEVGRLLGGMIAKADTFVDQSPFQLREAAVEYIIDLDSSLENE